MTEVRALTADEWRRLRLARMAAVEAMPYFARALFALSPVAAPGLGTFAVDRHWRLYLDPAMLGTDKGWSIPLAGAVLLHEVGHVLRDHGGRADTVDCPVDRTMWNYAADAEINDDLIAAGVGLPVGVVTPSAIGCEDGHAAEVYYRHLVPPGTPRSGADTAPGDGAGGGEDDGYGCGSGAGDAPVPGELPAAADLGSGKGLSTAAADLVKVAVARAVQQELHAAGLVAAPCQRAWPGGLLPNSPRLSCRGPRCCALRCAAPSRTRRARCTTPGGVPTGAHPRVCCCRRCGHPRSPSICSSTRRGRWETTIWLPHYQKRGRCCGAPEPRCGCCAAMQRPPRRARCARSPT